MDDVPAVRPNGERMERAHRPRDKRKHGLRLFPGAIHKSGDHRAYGVNSYVLKLQLEAGVRACIAHAVQAGF